MTLRGVLICSSVYVNIRASHKIPRDRYDPPLPIPQPEFEICFSALLRMPDMGEYRNSKISP